VTGHLGPGTHFSGWGVNQDLGHYSGFSDSPGLGPLAAISSFVVTHPVKR